MSSLVVPRWVVRSLFNSIADLYQKIEYVKGLIMSNQETLDVYVAELTDVFDKLSVEIQDLKDAVAAGAAPESLDWTGLEAQVQRGVALEPPVLEEPPVESPPEQAV